jgi:hypothetical protein
MRLSVPIVDYVRPRRRGEQRFPPDIWHFDSAFRKCGRPVDSAFRKCDLPVDSALRTRDAGRNALARD